MEAIFANINTVLSVGDSLTGIFSGYKGYVCAGLAAAAVIFCVILFILKKRNPKNFLFVLGVLVLCTAAVLLTNFQSAESFYGKNGSTEGEINVSLTVRCDSLVGQSGEYIPADGCILSETQYTVSKGDTVYDVLVRAVRENEIQLECDGAVGDNTLAYVKGINYIYEFDYGELSGWMYCVNGVSPSTGCGAYELSDGDEIQWLYTLELGKDIGLMQNFTERHTETDA